MIEPRVQTPLPAPPPPPPCFNRTQSNLIEHNRSIVFGNPAKSNTQLFVSSIMFDFVRKPNKNLKADLHGTIFAYDCRMREHVLLASWKNRIQFPRYQIACGYDCRRVLKHVSKARNILLVVHDSREQVVCLIYTKQVVS